MKTAAIKLFFKKVAQVFLCPNEQQPVEVSNDTTPTVETQEVNKTKSSDNEV